MSRKKCRRGSFGLALALLAGVAGSPICAQETSSPAAPLDIAPPRQLDPVAQPIKLVKQPRKPRVIVFGKETEKPAFVTVAWPAEGPVNSRAADAIIARMAAQADQASKPAAAAPVAKAAATPAPQPAEITTFCANIADAARDARNALQMAKIAELETSLKQRMEALEKSKAELRLLLDRQKEAEKRADDGLIAIFTRMRPEAAAAQLSAADETTAAAILTKLNPRGASVILNEIDPGKAARLTEAMARGRTTRLAAETATP